MKIMNWKTFVFVSIFLICSVVLSSSTSTYNRYKPSWESNSSIPCREEDGYHQCYVDQSLMKGDYCIRRDIASIGEGCNQTNQVATSSDEEVPCHGNPDVKFESKFFIKEFCLYERYIKCREESEVECLFEDVIENIMENISYDDTTYDGTTYDGTTDDITDDILDEELTVVDQERIIFSRCKPRSYIGQQHTEWKVKLIGCNNGKPLKCNNYTEFQCHDNGRCIPREWVVDRLPDCVDGSDEITSLTCHNDTEFRCSSGRCLARYRINDGFADCRGGGDENVTNFNCAATEFDCKNPDFNRCIPRYWVGNNIIDCKSKRDEVTRFDSCLPDETMCADKSRCVPRSYLCDGIQHCADASDEIVFCDEPRLFSCFRSPSLHIPWSYTFHHQSTKSCHPNDSSETYTSALIGFKCKTKHILADDPIVLVPQFYLHNNISVCQDSADVCFDGDRFNCARCLDNKTIISREQICDDFIDCPDLSDECSCERSKVEGLCALVFDSVEGAGLKANLSTFCDGKRDLVDGVDEKYCKVRTSDASRNYTCLSKGSGDGVESIPMSQYCDGIPDCQYKDDECKLDCLERRKENLEICFPKEVNCTIKSELVDYSVPKRNNSTNAPTVLRNKDLFYNLCNGLGECTGDVDEAECPWRIICDTNSYELNLNSDRRCDGVADCVNMEDEQNCANDKVFTCWSGKTQTIEIEKYQDGRQDCDDNSDECKNEDVSSPREMIKVGFLLHFVWVSSTVTLIGNAVVMYRNCRYLTHQTTFKHSVSYVNKLFITHLALSDFIMGIALFIIAIKSKTFTDQYCSHDYEWRPSTLCNIVGVLIMISAETSLNILVLLTAFRMYISYKPFNTSKLNLKLCHGLICMCWFIALMFALFPIILIDVFSDDFIIERNKFFLTEKINRTAFNKFKHRTVQIAQLSTNHSQAFLTNYFFDGTNRAAERFPTRDVTIKRQISYYGASSVCFPDLYANKMPQYNLSVTIISYNLMALLAVLCCYVLIYKRSKAIMTSSSTCCQTDQIRRDEDTLKRRILWIVMIDKLCWIPIIVMAVLSYSGSRIRGLAHSFTFIILIPIQSAMNPIIYSRFDRTILEKGEMMLEKIRHLRDKRPSIVGGTSTGGQQPPTRCSTDFSDSQL